MNDFWLPDDPDTAELGNIIEAAEALGMSEYDFFHLAFHRWNGREPRSVALEKTFAEYMFHRTVPHGVRHLAREVLGRKADGSLNIVRMGVNRYQQRIPMPKNGRFHVSVLGVAFVVYCLALVEISYDPQTSAPMPCNGGSGLTVISKMVYAVSGKRPPSCGQTPSREVAR